MDPTPSLSVEEYNFACNICCNVYEDPIIIDCPCKCIMCKKCLSRYWEMELQTNDSQLHEFEALKRCKNNVYVSVNMCWKAEGLSKVVRYIE